MGTHQKSLSGRKPAGFSAQTQTLPARRILEAVLWISSSGAQWHTLPQCHPNHKTVHCRFQNWCRADILRDLMVDLPNELKEQNMEMIAAHPKNPGRKETPDGRRLRRYERRWSVERFRAWIQWQGRILIRWEYCAENFLGFVQLATTVVLLRTILR